MIRIQIDETVHRPIEEVFDRLVDIDRYPDWMPDGGLLITCTKDSDGPVDEGTKYSDKTRFGTFHGEIEGLERPTRVTFHYTVRRLGITVMEGWPGYRLERLDDDTTRVRHTATGRLKGPFKLLRPMVRWLAQSERQRTVDALKASMESEI